MAQNYRKMFRTFLVLFSILIAIHTAVAMPAIPMSVDGVAMIDGKIAPEGSVITAKMDNVIVDEYVVSSSGEYMLTIEGEFEDSGKEVSFFINDIDSQESENWESGKTISIALSVTTSNDDNEDTGSSSTSSSSSSFISHTNSEIENNDPEVAESEQETSGSTEEAEVTGEEESVTDAPEETTDDSESPEPSSENAPGFNLIFALSGIILVYFISNGKKR